MTYLRFTACATALSLVVAASPGLLAQSSAARPKSANLASRPPSPATGGADATGAREIYPVTMRLSSRLAFAPAVVRSTVRVTPHPDNRLLRLTLDSPDYYRSSDVQLDGASAASAHFFNWTSLPAGSYSVVATVFGPDGPRAQTVATLDVRGLSR